MANIITALEISKKLPMRVKTPSKMLGLVKGKEIKFEEVKTADNYFKLIGTIRGKDIKDWQEFYTHNPSDEFEVIDETNR